MMKNTVRSVVEFGIIVLIWLVGWPGLGFFILAEWLYDDKESVEYKALITIGSVWTAVWWGSLLIAIGWFTVWVLSGV